MEDVITPSLPDPEEIVDTYVIYAAASVGIVQIAFALIALWFVVGYLTRFRTKFTGQQAMVYSAIGCLSLAFIEGCMRSFVLTNVFVAGAENNLKSRCGGVLWHYIFILQLTQVLIYVFLLSRMRSLDIFQDAMYYFLLLLILSTTLLTAVILPWYNLPEIVKDDEENPELFMCDNASYEDNNVFEDYLIFLCVDGAAQLFLLTQFFVQFYRICTECGCCTCGPKNKSEYRILTLGVIVILFNFSEYLLFGVTKGSAMHAARFILYSIVIMCAFNICGTNEKTGDKRWCFWCLIPNSAYAKVSVRGDDENNGLEI